MRQRGRCASRCRWQQEGLGDKATQRRLVPTTTWLLQVAARGVMVI